MNKIFLTWASNLSDENIEQYLVFFNSANLIQNASVVCLTNKLEDKYKNQIKKTGTIIHYSDYPCHNIICDRWLHYWNYLKCNLNNSQICICDSRDVFIQDDPFLYLKNKQIVITSEGFQHYQSDWNMKDQFGCQKNVGEFTQNHYFWQVLNGGIVLGERVRLQDFCFLMWSSSIRSQSFCTDQGTLNYLMSYLKDDPAFQICNPYDSNFCITGEAIKEKLLKFEPEFLDGKITKNKIPYAIFHQWDRTFFKEKILCKYTK